MVTRVLVIYGEKDIFTLANDMFKDIHFDEASEWGQAEQRLQDHTYGVVVIASLRRPFTSSEAALRISVLSPESLIFLMTADLHVNNPLPGFDKLIHKIDDGFSGLVSAIRLSVG